ncbi:MAG: SDR family oxidoreductase [Phycisphaerales bacterium]|nr:SDR family oxidoreductase [Phycisphaerales bacterium]
MSATGGEQGRQGATGRPRAFVLGGARRVGRAITVELARAGCDVDFSYHTSEEGAAETVGLLRGYGSDARAWRLSLSDPDAAGVESQKIAASRVTWDVVVLCASTYDATPIERLSAEQLMRAYAVNAASQAVVLGSFVDGLRTSVQRGGGAVVTMCDVHAMGETGLPRRGMLAYAMSKAALVEMTLVLAKELAPSVRVNGVAPGVVAWPESGPDADAAAQARYLARVPLGRAGTPEEAAGAVRWLALEATYCTGQVVRLDGGRSLG